MAFFQVRDSWKTPGWVLSTGWLDPPEATSSLGMVLPQRHLFSGRDRLIWIPMKVGFPTPLYTYG